MGKTPSDHLILRNRQIVYITTSLNTMTNNLMELRIVCNSRIRFTFDLPLLRIFEEFGKETGKIWSWYWDIRKKNNISKINHRVCNKLEIFVGFDSEMHSRGDFCILDMVSTAAKTETVVYRFRKRYISTPKTTLFFKLNWLHWIWNRSLIFAENYFRITFLLYCDNCSVGMMILKRLCQHYFWWTSNTIWGVLTRCQTAPQCLTGSCFLW